MVSGEINNNQVGRRSLPIVLWTTAVLLFWLVLRSVSLAETWAVLRRLDSWQLVLLLLANGTVLLLLNGRWWLILTGQGHRIPFFRLTAYRLAGTSLSYLTPGPQFGGEPLQILLIERNHRVPRTTAVAAITLDKTLELVVNFSFLLTGVVLIWQTQLLGAGVGWPTAAFVLLLLSLPLGCLISFWLDWRIFTVLTSQFIQLLGDTKRVKSLQKLQSGIAASEEQIAHFCHQHPCILLLAFLISLLSWLALMAEFWLMLTLLGLSVTFVRMLIVLTAARVALLLPFPGGLGTLEASQIWAFTTFGFEPAAAISFSLLIRARDVFLATLGLWLARAALGKTQDSL